MDSNFIFVVGLVLIVVGLLAAAAYSFLRSLIFNFMRDKQNTPKYEANRGLSRMDTDIELAPIDQDALTSADNILNQARQLAEGMGTGTNVFPRIQSWTSVGRTQLNLQRCQEISSLVALAQQTNSIARVSQDRALADETRKTELLAQKIQQVELALRGAIVKAAAEAGMSVIDYEGRRMKLHDMEIEVSRIRQTLQAEAEKEGMLAAIRNEEQEKKDALEVKKAKKLAKIQRKQKAKENKIDQDNQDSIDRAELEFGEEATVFKDHRRIRQLTKWIVELEKEIGTPYVIFEVIAALKVSNSLSVQQWSLRPAVCAGVWLFKLPCFRHRL